MPFVLPEAPNPGFAIEGSLAKPGIPLRSVWVGGGILGSWGHPPLWSCGYLVPAPPNLQWKKPLRGRIGRHHPVPAIDMVRPGYCNGGGEVTIKSRPLLTLRFRGGGAKAGMWGAEQQMGPAPFGPKQRTLETPQWGCVFGGPLPHIPLLGPSGG